MRRVDVLFLLVLVLVVGGFTAVVAGRARVEVHCEVPTTGGEDDRGHRWVTAIVQRNQITRTPDGWVVETPLEVFVARACTVRPEP